MRCLLTRPGFQKSPVFCTWKGFDTMFLSIRQHLTRSGNHFYCTCHAGALYIYFTNYTFLYVCVYRQGFVFVLFFSFLLCLYLYCIFLLKL